MISTTLQEVAATGHFLADVSSLFKRSLDRTGYE